MADTPDPIAIIRSRNYVKLLVISGLLGVPVSVFAYYFIWGTNKLQTYAFTTLPDDLGYNKVPMWWPIIPLVLAGLFAGAAIKYLPGNGGAIPVHGLAADEVVKPNMLLGIFCAAFASISLGAVVGPEAPLIGLGGGIAYWAFNSLKKDAPDQTKAVVAASGSFAAVSALFGSPILAAFLMLEASGLGGPMAALVLIPGLLSAGIGDLVFIGLDSLTGLGKPSSLVIPNLPHVGAPTVAEFGYAILIGIACALVGTLIRRGALQLLPSVQKRILTLTVAFGLTTALFAIAFEHFTNQSSSLVLFSGETTLPTLISLGAELSVGTLLLLIVCKGAAYCLALCAFRGGPTFPAMFIGAAIGVAMSHLPGLAMVPAMAMGIGAMSAVILRLPIASVLLAGVILASDAAQVMPLIIVAVVVAYVAALQMSPPKGDRLATTAPAH